MIVMKFGGTSVMDQTAIQRSCGIVQGRLDRKPVVVVSAMAKVTDQLLAMGRAAGAGDREQALQLSQALRDRHYNTARELLGPAAYEQFHGTLEQEFDTLDELLRGIAAVGELSPRTSDYVVSYGERLSSKMCAAAFSAMGVNSALVDAREVMITDGQHTKAVPQVEEIDARAEAIMGPMLEAGCVPVVGGFIGATRDGVQTTIGRGGSDYSAALFGAALNAEVIEIWTDVDGMMTTDPRICPEAHRIKVISFEEAAELAYFGAKVLHPATVLPAIRKNIPVRVLNSHNPANEGTLIVARAPHSRSVFKAIAAKKGITIVERVRHAHADGAWIPAAALRGLRPLSLLGRCGCHLRSQRLHDRRFRPGAAPDRRRPAKNRRRPLQGTQRHRLHGGRKHSREPGIAAQVFTRARRHQRAHDFARRIGNQHHVRD